MRRALPGELYVDPVSAATGGTRVVNIDDRRHSFDPGRRTRLYKPDLMFSAFDVTAGLSVAPTLRVVPLSDSAAIIRLLFAASVKAGKVSADGAPDFADIVGVPLALRPFDGDGPILYGPSWKPHPDSVTSIVWHPTDPYLEGSELLLVPTSDPSPNVDPWMLDTAAAIDAHYDLEAEA
jgi:hypothetical protein